MSVVIKKTEVGGNDNSKRPGHKKYAAANQDLVKKRSLMCGLRKGRKAKPQTLDNNDMWLSDFTQDEYQLLDANVLAHLVFKDFLRNQQEEKKEENLEENLEEKHMVSIETGVR